MINLTDKPKAPQRPNMSSRDVQLYVLKRNKKRRSVVVNQEVVHNGIEVTHNGNKVYY